MRDPDRIVRLKTVLARAGLPIPSLGARNASWIRYSEVDGCLPLPERPAANRATDSSEPVNWTGLKP
jgi:hypothetical protein